MVTRAFGYAVCTVLVLGLAACGNSRGDRALTGGAIGAAGGAALGAVLPGIGPAGGALIGGAAGAATGALTDKNDIDIGDPIYK
jgi:osmotically inducible lipoprotein OsmB